MGIKSQVLQLYSKRTLSRSQRSADQAIPDQKKWFDKLIKTGAHTSFGKDHGLNEIRTYKEYCDRVHTQDYEGLRPYVDQVINGNKDVLWPGIPKYFAKTSGTTSGTKYIPISKDSIKSHIATASTTIFNYVARERSSLFDGKLIFLSGSPELTNTNGILTGRLSGIVNHEIPSWLRSNQLPSYKTNCISDWNQKLDKIVEETHDKDMRLISGIPPWVQMYYEKLLDRTGKNHIIDIFPNLELFVHGGVNYEPYKSGLEKLVGKEIVTLETYPASEGFIAFQNDHHDESLLLNTNAGIFYEFIPLKEIDNQEPQRLTLEQIETDINYALVMTTNAGLWSYIIGDVVKFTSTYPFKLKVTGRIKHFLSAFGEHVIAEEVENAISYINKSFGMTINEFTVAPMIKPPEGLPYHEWFIESKEDRIPWDKIADALDAKMIDQNIYYRDLINDGVLRSLKITRLAPGTFRNMMEKKGKLGGQNKVPRLMNDRSIVDGLL